MTATKEKREPKTNQESWSDLLFNMGIPIPSRASRISRAELLARLRPPGPDLPRMTPVQLVDWEMRGILPRAVIQMHEGKVQAVYPSWWIPLVENAYALSKRGYSRDQAGRAARSWINTTGRTLAFAPLDTNLEAVHTAVAGLLRSYRHQQMADADRITGARVIFVDAEGETVFETGIAFNAIDLDVVS